MNDIYDYKQLDIFERSDIWEGQFIEIRVCSSKKKVILGNIYRPPRDLIENYEMFINEFSAVLQKIQRSKNEILVGGDFNIDLLRLHDKQSFATFFDTVTSMGI